MPPLLIGEASPLLGKLVRSAGETRNSFHTQAAQQPLFNRGDDGAAGLLNAVGGRQPENISGIARLEHPGRESRTASVSREFSSFTQTPSFHKKKTRREPVAQAPCGFFFSCASRSRTYDGGVKVPCLTAWRWRTGKNQYSRISFICQAKAFCRVCAKCFATLLPCLYSVLVIMRTACPFSALFSQKVLTPPS